MTLCGWTIPISFSGSYLSPELHVFLAYLTPGEIHLDLKHNHGTLPPLIFPFAGFHLSRCLILSLANNPNSFLNLVSYCLSISKPCRPDSYPFISYKLTFLHDLCHRCAHNTIICHSLLNGSPSPFQTVLHNATTDFIKHKCLCHSTVLLSNQFGLKILKALKPSSILAFYSFISLLYFIF